MRAFSRSSAPALFLGLSLAGLAAATAIAQGDPAPLRCEIALTALDGGTRIEGRLHSDRPLAGTWEMQVTSRSAGGSTALSQSGDFDMRPGTEVLADVTLLGAPATHHADLTLTTNAQRLTCAEAEM